MANVIVFSVNSHCNYDKRDDVFQQKGRKIGGEILFWLFVSCIALLLIIVVLLVKIILLRKAVDEIRVELRDKLDNDTNTLISLSGNDRHIQLLANDLNAQLRILRKERQRFQSGDRELKDAITNISHDLRTPLTAIYGYLDLLEKEDKSTAISQYLSIIKNRTDALKHLTEELFRYSILTMFSNDNHCERLSLNGALEEAISSYYLALKERGITPDITMPDKPVKRYLDKNALSRIFGNIINNAVKYSDGDLAITLSSAGEICFTNTAVALDEIQVGKLFDRFYTVESARKSTGLGLSIAKILVEQMNGGIHAYYRNKKLCVCITFPGDMQKADDYPT